MRAFATGWLTTVCYITMALTSGNLRLGVNADEVEIIPRRIASRMPNVKREVNWSILESRLESSSTLFFAGNILSRSVALSDHPIL